MKNALQAVERILEVERKPRLAGDVDHTYGAKYGLVNLTSNTAIIAYINCLEKIGLDASVLKSIDTTKPTTIRFDASTACKFLEEVVVDVPVNATYKEEESKSSHAIGNWTRTTMKKVGCIDVLSRLSDYQFSDS